MNGYHIITHIITKDIINTINIWEVLTQFIHGAVKENIWIPEICKLLHI